MSVKWYGGVGSQEKMFKFADSANHKVYLSKEHYINLKTTRSYTSFKSWDDFLKMYYPRNIGSWHILEIIREKTKCRPYFDLDWDYSKYDDDEIIKAMNIFIPKFMNGAFHEKVDNLVYISSSSSDIIGSIHCIIPDYYITDNVKFKDYITDGIMKYGGHIIRDAIDLKVYTKNRTMRIVYSTKLGDPLRRMFRPVVTSGKCPQIQDTLITYLTGSEKKID